MKKICSCEKRRTSSAVLSKSSNAFWNRSKRNRKKLSTINARSVPPNRTKGSLFQRQNSTEILDEETLATSTFKFDDQNLNATENFSSTTQLQSFNDELTTENIRKTHLCCKPITSVQKLSTHDKKKLIENDFLTLISLLPTYLAAQGDFQRKIREKTQISNDAAAELERLMDEWGSARLFIGAQSNSKSLSQTI